MMTNMVLHNDPDVPRPSMTFREMFNALPGTSGFISKPHESGLKSDFYVLMEECNKAANTMKDIEKRTPKEIKEALEDKVMIKRAGMARDLNKVAKDLSEIRNYIEYVNNAPESKFTAEQKQKEIKKMRDIEQKFLMQMDIKKLRKMAEL